MIIGLLNLQGSPQLQSFVQQKLLESGLLSITDTVYYSRTSVPHPNLIRVPDDPNLYLEAKRTPDAFVWSLSTASFITSTKQSLADWLQYEVFFIVEQWQLAVQKLREGY